VSYYFMGKDNITFHSQIWPAELLGYAGRGDRGGEPGAAYGVLNLPTEVVASEFMTMEGRQFSTSRGHVIYVRDVLERYGPDALRYFICAAGPENQDSDFTWAEFVQRNNSELVAGWGNLVSRTAAMVAKNFGEIPQPGPLEPSTRRCSRHGHAVRSPRSATHAGAQPGQGRARRGDADRRRGQRLRLAHRALQAQG
jgi:methionyl-tRNA synthetase